MLKMTDGCAVCGVGQVLAARQVWEANTDWQNTRVPVGSVAERDCGQYSVHKVQTVPAVLEKLNSNFIQLKQTLKALLQGCRAGQGPPQTLRTPSHAPVTAAARLRFRC